MAEPDLELRWRGGSCSFVLFTKPAFLPSVISSFLQNNGRPPGPSPKSSTGFRHGGRKSLKPHIPINMDPSTASYCHTSLCSGRFQNKHTNCEGECLTPSPLSLNPSESPLQIFCSPRSRTSARSVARPDQSDRHSYPFRNSL